MSERKREAVLRITTQSLFGKHGAKQNSVPSFSRWEDRKQAEGNRNLQPSPSCRVGPSMGSGGSQEKQ